MATHQFGNIFLADRGAGAQGQLKVSQSGMAWKKAGGERKVDLTKADIVSLIWSKISRGCQLIVKEKNGKAFRFHGFRESDLNTLKDYSSAELGKDIEERAVATSGHNWGEVEIDGYSMSFDVNGKTAFDVPLGDVSQVTGQGKNEVTLEFQQDDTVGENDKDSLVELSFHIPPTSAKWVGEEENPSVKVLMDALKAKADVGVAGSGEAVVTFDEVAIITPRGRFDIELHLNFLKLMGQNMDFKIQYSSIVRLFVLPKANQPHTVIVISLDPPIRRGQTFYPHMLMQFPTDEEIDSLDLDISDESFESKNAQHGGKLEKSYSGQTWDVLVRVLRGLSGAKITRPGAFRNNTGDAHAVRCSLKADDGYLYPLEKCFFYIQKPPTLITYDEVESVEFERQGGAGHLGSSSFDLAVRLKSDIEHKFRSISKQEYSNMFNFLSAKKIKIDNLKESQPAAGRGALAESDEDDDPHMRRVAAEAGDEDSSEDEDFKAGSDDESEDVSSEDESGSEGEGGGDSDGGSKKKKKKKKKEQKKEKKRKAEKATPKKKKRAKKDKDAPKNALSAFMYFSSANRERMKQENPDVTFGGLGKLLGAAWKELDAEGKKEYEEKAAQDKIRYAEAMKEYKAKKASEAEKGSDDDDEEEEEEEGGGGGDDDDDDDAGGDSD